MPWITNEDGSETDTGTGAVTEKPDYMAPADRATQPEAVAEEPADGEISIVPTAAPKMPAATTKRRRGVRR